VACETTSLTADLEAADAAGEPLFSGRHRLGEETGKIMAVSIMELKHYLHGVDYPSGKDGLIRKARENQAPRDVIDLINSLPDREFNSTLDVSQAVGEIE